MNKIQVTQFANIKEITSHKEFGFKMKVDIKHSAQNKIVALEALFDFKEKDGDIFLLLGVQCNFEIHPSDWGKCTKGDDVIIPKETMDYLLSQTVGVARGVLHCKTEGTNLNGLVLPPLDVSKVIKEDIHIPLKQ